MVAIIKTGYSLRRTFQYNENKVREGVAQLIGVGNYPMESAAMTATHRLNMLVRIAATNPAVRRNSVHISLNFAPGEVLSPEKLNRIAAQYMEAIGFGNQPYLVYEHRDAAHPHVHIVTTKVRQDGTAIRMQNIGKKLSEPARKRLEKEHGLAPAETHRKAVFRMRPVTVEKAIYGKAETRKAIGNVLEYVLERYRYTSLAELNAVLNLYNVHAEAGQPGSRLRAHGGLQYRLLDAQRQPVGVPIKASLFHNGPTLAWLQNRFAKNGPARKGHAERVKAAIDQVLHRNRSLTPERFSSLLKRTGINVVERRNDHGFLYGMTYVDHGSRCVFNGSDLGAPYTASGITKHFQTTLKLEPPAENRLLPRTESIPDGTGNTVLSGLWDALTAPTQESSYVPYELRPKRRKRRKRKPNDNLNS